MMPTVSDELREAMDGVVPVLYHGTVPGDAERLLRDGFILGRGSFGGNMGQGRYLYLTNTPENARWFSNEKGEDVVLELRDVPFESLAVDPEDGTHDTVEEELAMAHGMPGNVVLTRSLPASHFRRYEGLYAL